jgi:hypothetical protein
MPGIPFCILIGQAGSHGFHYLGAYKVFGGDELNAPLLTLMLVLDHGKKINISLHGALILKYLQI